MSTEPRPDCYRCQAFFVTYDPARPYGCRVFGMKSRTLPSIVVQNESGKPCHAFTPKAAPTR